MEKAPSIDSIHGAFGPLANISGSSRGSLIRIRAREQWVSCAGV